MEAITLHAYSEMRYIWSRTVKYLSQYARRASQLKDRQTGRLQYGVEPINA